MSCSKGMWSSYNMKAEAGGERHSVVVWEGKSIASETVAKKRMMGMTGIYFEV